MHAHLRCISLLQLAHLLFREPCIQIPHGGELQQDGHFSMHCHGCRMHRSTHVPCCPWAIGFPPGMMPCIHAAAHGAHAWQSAPPCQQACLRPAPHVRLRHSVALLVPMPAWSGEKDNLVGAHGLTPHAPGSMACLYKRAFGHLPQSFLCQRSIAMDLFVDECYHLRREVVEHVSQRKQLLRIRCYMYTLIHVKRCRRSRWPGLLNEAGCYKLRVAHWLYCVATLRATER